MLELPKLKETLNIDVTVTPENVEDDLFKIYSQLLKGVKKEDLEFQELQGGFVNSIYRVFLKQDASKSLVFRTFGFKLNAESFNKSMQEMKDKKKQEDSERPNDGAENEKKDNSTTDFPDFDIGTAFFNRITEFSVMNEVSKYGLCQPVYAKYKNGICYGFSHGVTLTGPLMLTYDFLNEIAPKLARFHCIKFDMPEIKFKTHHERMHGQLGNMFEQMASILDQNMKEVNEFPYDVFPSILSLAEEEKKINEILGRIGMGEIVFCHNDPNQKNIIWNPQERTLSFIDFEMTMNNYDIMEIGQLFVCYCGHFLCDWNGEFFPSESYRKRFLKLYLEEKNRINQVKKSEKEFEDDLQKIFVQTNLTSLLFMVKIITMTPSFDFQPDFFNNPDLLEKRKTTKYYCGKFGYEIYKHYATIKDELMKSGESYLEDKNEK